MRAFFARLAAYVALSMALALTVPVWFSPDRSWQYVSSPKAQSRQEAYRRGPVLREVPGLKAGRLVLGGALFVAGIWLLRRRYRPRRGVAVAPGWVVVLADVLYILTGGMGAYGLCYYLLNRWWGVVTPWDQMALEFVAMAYLPGLAMLAGFASQWSAQSLEVDERGLTRHGPGGRRFTPWDQVRGFDLEETALLVGRGDMLLPRHLQTKLVIKTADGAVNLFEPGAKAKRKLLGLLKRQAPPRLQGDIERLAGEW